MEPYLSYKIGSQAVHLYNYTEASIALVSSKEFAGQYLENLKALGGRYNPSLREIGKGWIFSKKSRQKDVEAFLEKIVAAPAEAIPKIPETIISRTKLPTPKKVIKPPSRLPDLMNELITELTKITTSETHKLDDDHTLMVFNATDEISEDLDRVLEMVTATHRLIIVPK